MRPPTLTIDLPVRAGWDATLAAIDAAVAPHRGEGELTIGLRLTDADSRELWEGSRLTRFKAHLDEQQLVVVAMVATPVDDWRSEAAGAYALRLAHLLAYLLPHGTVGSIQWSTPAPSGLGPIEKETAIRHIMRVVEGLVWLQDELDATLQLHLEADRHELQTLGVPSLAARLGVSASEAAGKLATHLVMREPEASSAA